MSGIDRALYALNAYEYVFGDMPCDEFVKTFPQWYTADALFSGKYQRRCGLALPQSLPGEHGTDRSGWIRPVPRRIYEEKLLKERQTRRGEAPVSQEVAAYVRRKQEAPHGRSVVETRAAGVERQREAEVVFVPFDRSPEQYLGPINDAIERMQSASEQERLRIFFSNVWPQVLIARADRIDNEAGEARIQVAVQLLATEDGTLAPVVSELVDLSNDVDKNAERITALSVQLRNSEYLHQRGTYVHSEILHRRQSTPDGKSVQLLSSVSYSLDEIHTYEVEGTPLQMFDLGERLDTLDEEIAALGFTYTGDTHGVVLKEQIRRQANESLLPRLNTSTRYLVPEGEIAHPLNQRIGTALRRDYDSNPNERARQKIYDSRYRSTRTHEKQHREEEVREVQAQYANPIDRRVAQETTAYLSSIAEGSRGGDTNAPFTDLVKVIELYVSYRENPLRRLDDWFGIYEQASERILQLIAREFQMTVSHEDLQVNYLDICDQILATALERMKRRETLAQLAQKVLDEEQERQRRGESLRAVPAPERPPAPERGEPEPEVPVSPRQVEEELVAPEREEPILPEQEHAPTDRSAEADQRQETEHSAPRRRVLDKRIGERVRNAVLAVSVFAAGVGIGTDMRRAMEEPLQLPPATKKESLPRGKELPAPEKKSDAWVRPDRAHAQDVFRRGVWGYAEYLLAQSGWTQDTAFDYVIENMREPITADTDFIAINKVAEQRYILWVDHLKDQLLQLLADRGVIRTGEDPESWARTMSAKDVEKMQSLVEVAYTLEMIRSGRGPVFY